jgi:NADPH2:quinone reductase
VKAVVAARRGGPEVLELREVPEPLPGPGQALIRVLRSAVNFADLHSTQGRYAHSPEPPFIPGLEVAGYDAESGRSVLALVPSGGYAERVAADRLMTFDAEGLDLEQVGGAALVTLTSYYALRHVARLQEGETVLVLAAAGGLGSTSVQMARALGAGTVIGVASTDPKRRQALAQGADLALGYEDPFPPVDVVVDGVGGPASERALKAVRQMGRILMLGFASGTPPWIPDFTELRARNVGILAFSFGALRKAEPDRVAASAGPAFDLIRSGRVRPAPGITLPLDQASKAHRLLASRESTGKILLAPGG